MENSREPERLNFLRKQENDGDLFKYQLWHKLNDLVHEQIKKDCQTKHQEEEKEGMRVVQRPKKKVPPAPHNSVMQLP